MAEYTKKEGRGSSSHGFVSVKWSIFMDLIKDHVYKKNFGGIILP